MLSAIVAAIAAASAPAPALPAGTEIVGRSVGGRPIVMRRVGSPRARTRILAVGVIHGSERAGLAVTRALRRARPPRGTALYLVDELNPDGAATGSRHNARGVDLNRNFPEGWAGGGKPGDTHYAGPSPASEPETRVAQSLTARLHPRVTVWYHQALRRVVDRTGGDRSLRRLYARRSGLPLRPFDRLPGTAVAWQNRRLPGSTAFVVELPGGPLSRAGARRHTGAVLALARAIAPPRVRRTPIPFGERRRREMRAYARRHYGIDDFRLRSPKVIVEHYTASNSFRAAFDTFAADRPDVELHELPGVCAHFLIDRDGAVHQLVSTRIMCRHTVGLNYTAIGIEHVGTSDGQVLGNRRQLRASLRLTRWLQGRHRISTPNVIGHNESLGSPYHGERVARLRRQTHGDFNRRSMNRYRRSLRRLPAPASVR